MNAFKYEITIDGRSNISRDLIRFSDFLIGKVSSVINDMDWNEGLEGILELLNSVINDLTIVNHCSETEDSGDYGYINWEHFFYAVVEELKDTGNSIIDYQTGQRLLYIDVI